MAQQREKKEEASPLHAPETLALTLTRCINNCGFYGSPATRNMCQSCFHRASAAGISTPASGSVRDAINAPAEEKARERKGGAKEEEEEEARGEGKKRCFGCRRKVGLLGFRCRCGELFCGEHRYSDRHACGFDYRAASREAIARENPVVRAAKIVRI